MGALARVVTIKPHSRQRKIVGLGMAMLLLMLSSCGFQLRGAYQFPAAMSQTYIQASNQNSELLRQLKRTLRASDIQLVNNPSEASARLRVFAETQSKRIISVDTRGRAREYELSYGVSFELIDLQSDKTLDAHSLRLQRDFLFDTEDVLGKGQEEAKLIKEMQQDMVRLILLRLQTRTK